MTLLKYTAILSLIFTGYSASAGDRPVCEVVHGQNHYTDDVIRVSNYGHANDEWSDCSGESAPKMTATSRKDRATKKLKEMNLATLRVQFAPGSAEIKSADNAKVEKLGSFLQDNKKVNIAIIGHTDSTGSETLNKNLSQKRAQAVANKLTDMGVDSERLSVSGVGSDQPVADNETQEGRYQNRRIAIEVQ